MEPVDARPPEDADVTAPTRIQPIARADRDADTEELLRTSVGDHLATLNIFATLVRHRRLFKRWTRFGALLLNGSIPERDRELLILRTAHNCGCSYEWGHHREIAQSRGLTAAEVDAVRVGRNWSGWSPWDVTLLSAADELHEHSRLSDATWAALAERYDDQLLIEVPMLVGNYHLVAFTVNSLGIQLEEPYR
jgi:4-carboxymuconolactone decarboxylase